MFCLLVPPLILQRSILQGLFSTIFFILLCFLLVILLLKWFKTPVSGAEELSNVFKYRKALMCLTEKICKLGKLFSGMSYSSTGWQRLLFWLDISQLLWALFLSRLWPWPLLCLWPAQSSLKTILLSQVRENPSTVISDHFWYLSSLSPTFYVYVLGLPLVRIIFFSLVRISLPLMSPLSNFLSTDALTLLVGYKSPLVHVVFRVEPYFAPIIIPLFQYSSMKSSLPF